MKIQKIYIIYLNFIGKFTGKFAKIYQGKIYGGVLLSEIKFYRFFFSNGFGKVCTGIWLSVFMIGENIGNFWLIGSRDEQYQNF